MKKGIILIILLCSILIFDNVKADSIKAVSYIDFYNSDQYTSRYAYSNRHQYVNLLTTTDTGLNTLDFYYQDDKRNYDYITFNYLISGTSEITSTNNNRWYCNQYEKPSGNPYYYECQYFDSYSDQTQTYEKHYKITMSAYLYSVDGTTSTTACEVYDNYFRCPVINTNTNNWHLIVTYNNTSVGTYNYTYTYFQISQMITHYSYDSSAIINNQNQNTQTIIDSNTTYNNNATQDYTNQTNEMNSITNAEDTLMNNLDFNTTDMNITINPNASTFIWNIVDALRLMSTKIVLLMTSILSIGVIKLILNR